MRPTKTVWKNDNWQKRNYGGQSWCAQDCPAQDRPLPSMGDPEVGNPDFHSFNCIWHLLQVANTEQDVFFLFLTWLNFGSSLNTLPRVIIRTGFVQFLSPIDFCFLLQLSLTHSNYNLGNWQELIWLHFVKSQNSWTTSIQFNNNCSSFSINIIGNNNYCSSKVQQHWQNCRFQKSEFCILQKYWHVEIFTLSSLL